MAALDNAQEAAKADETQAEAKPQTEWIEAPNAGTQPEKAAEPDAPCSEPSNSTDTGCGNANRYYVKPPKVCSMTYTDFNGDAHDWASSITQSANRFAARITQSVNRAFGVGSNSMITTARRETFTATWDEVRSGEVIRGCLYGSVKGNVAEGAHICDDVTGSVIGCMAGLIDGDLLGMIGGDLAASGCIGGDLSGNIGGNLAGEVRGRLHLQYREGLFRQGGRRFLRHHRRSLHRHHQRRLQGRHSGRFLRKGFRRLPRQGGR